MAAAVVAVRNARRRQAPLKHALEGMVDSGAEALRKQAVLVFDIGKCHVDLGDDLNKEVGGKSLKIKFRMQDLTYLKATAERASLPHCDHQCVAFGAMGSTIYEGSEDLRFDLCVAHRFRSSSQAIACGHVLLKDVLASLEDGQSASFNIELRDSASLCKVLANLNASIGVRLSTLQAAGGLSALKSIMPPFKSERYSVFALGEYTSSCKSYAHQAAAAQQSLQTAFEIATSYMKDQQQARKAEASKKHMRQQRSSQRRISKGPGDQQRTMKAETATRSSLADARNQSAKKVAFDDSADDASTASGTTTPSI